MQVAFALKLQLTTDLTMFAHSGYQLSEMNTTDWIWNAQLECSFINKKLLVKLQGFDILRQLSILVLNERTRKNGKHGIIVFHDMKCYPCHGDLM